MCQPIGVPGAFPIKLILQAPGAGIHVMPQNYEGLGISLMYPDGWKLDLAGDANEEEPTGVSFESPCGAFISITRSSDTDGMSAVASARAVMESEYEEVESEDYTRRIADMDFHVVEQRFVYLDFIIVSQIMSFTMSEQTYLVQIQGEDRDLHSLERVFEAMLTSIFRDRAA